MIYCNHGPKRDLLNGNCGTLQVENYVFGAKIMVMSEINVEMRNL